MSNSLKKQITEKKRAKSLIEEVDALKSTLSSVITQLNKVLAGADSRSREVEDVLKGVVHILGTDKVAEAVVKVKNDEIEADSAKKKENVLAAVAEGKLKACDTVTPNCVVIGTELRPDGTPTVPKENVVGFMTLNAELQSLLAGKKVGEVFEIPNTNGNTFQILELYDIVEEQAPDLAAQVAELEQQTA